VAIRQVVVGRHRRLDTGHSIVIRADDGRWFGETDPEI
jgi:hypothetical protein